MNKKLFIFLIVGLFFYGCGYKADPVYVPSKQDTKTKKEKK